MVGGNRQTMLKPPVSVLIDTYNHEQFIEQAITSVLEQDMSIADVEIIVVDDGSTDHTPEIVRKFEPRVRLIRKLNGGQASAFNTGVPECHGEIIAFLDGDDWWLPEKLAKVLAVFDANLEIGMVGHGTIATYGDGQQHTEVLKEAARFSLTSKEGALLFRCRKAFLGTRMTVRASVLKKLLPVPEVIRIEADEYVFTMAAALSGVYILPEALFHYRIHGNNQFSLTGFNENRVRRKQQSLAHLADHLETRLRGTEINEEVVRTAVQAVRVEADQLRLSIDGGHPWETVKAELAMYHLLHQDASWTHRAFKYTTTFPAYFLPPRLYYGARRWLAASVIYRRSRRIFFPVPQPRHIKRSWNVGT
jgi:glycosyltransferase involved in cell wall biosynthesis